MKPEHKLLLGDQATCARWLPAVRRIAKRLEALLALPNQVETDHVVFHDGTDAFVTVTADRRRLVIRAEPLGVSYEFFTSAGINGIVNFFGSPVQPQYFTDPYDDPPAICGRGSNHRWGKQSEVPKSAPVVDLCSPCAGSTDWDEAPCEGADGTDGMPTGEYWNRQRLHEHVWWPGNQGKTFLTSQAGAPPGSTMISRWSRGNYSKLLFGWYNTERDGQYNRPALYSHRAKVPSVVGAPTLSAGRAWRRACTRTVQGRTFVVMTDDIGTWYFWPAENYGDSEVPISAIKIASVDYPVWAEQGLGLWSFNSDGSRAVCCPHQRVAAPLDKYGEAVFKDIGYSLIRVDPDAYPSYATPAYESLPGLMEVAIDIVFSDDEWYPSVTVIRDEVFSDTGRFAFAADYLIGDERLPYPEDTLVVASFDLWARNGDLFIDESVGTHFPDDVNTVVRGAYVIEAWDQAVEAFVELQRIICCHDVYFAFVSLGGQSLDYNGDGTPDVFGTAESLEPGEEPGWSYPIHDATLKALNLRTLSWVARQRRYRSSNYNDKDFGISVYAYGEPAWSVADPGIAFPEAWSTLGYSRVETDKLTLWGNAMREYAICTPQSAFSWHPNGHWSVADYYWPHRAPYEGAQWMLDLVNVRLGGQDRLLSHQDLYNAAFSDERENGYYIDNVTAPFGTWRTSGVWRDAG